MAKNQATGGRPSLFRPKDVTKPRHFYLTNIGHGKVEAAKARLAKLTGWPAARISDGDLYEFLARGEQESMAYFRRHGILKAT